MSTRYQVPKTEAEFKQLLKLKSYFETIQMDKAVFHSAKTTPWKFRMAIQGAITIEKFS